MEATETYSGSGSILASREGAPNGAPSAAERAIMRLEAAYHRLGTVGNEMEKRLDSVLAPGWGEVIEDTYPAVAADVLREPSPLVAEIEQYARRFEMEIDRLSRILTGLDT